MWFFAMSMVLPAPAVVLGSRRNEGLLCTVQRDKRYCGDSFRSGGVLCFVMPRSLEQPRRRVQRRGLKAGVLVRAQQDSSKKNESNSLAQLAGTEPLRTAAKVAPSRDGLSAQPSSGEVVSDDSESCIVDPPPPSEEKVLSEDSLGYHGVVLCSLCSQVDELTRSACGNHHCSGWALT